MSSDSIKKVFVVKNQHGLYLNKQQEWIDGADSQALYRTPHRDEAINTVFEVSSKDIYLRAEAIPCALDAKGNPTLSAVLAPETEEAELIDEPAGSDDATELDSPLET